MPSLSTFSFSSYLTAFAANLRARRGWRRYAAAFACGLISALAFAPTNITPVLWICFPALIFLLQGAANKWQAFITGWSFAFGFFLLGLYWIAASMFVDLAHFWWAVPLSVAGLPTVFSFYYGIAAVLAWRLGLKGVQGVVAFALLWFLADYARGHLFTGFPWIIEGYAWTAVLPVLQITSVIGIYGLTLITLVCVSLPACLADTQKNSGRVVLASLVFLALLGLGGEVRLLLASNATVPDVRLRLVQPNIAQANKWASEEREENFRHLLDLTSATGEKPVTHIIWPETAATYYLTEDTMRRRVIEAHLPAAGALLTGVLRRHTDAEGVLHYYNSLVAIDDKARVVAGYDKFHLVPFGEYMPFRRYLPLKTLTNFGLDFTAGDGVHSLRVAGLPSFSPLICYEILFPGQVADPDDRPHFLLNVTNDGWYGPTAGPYQHFALARVRAIEEGIPLIRDANTGISGVVDAYGRVKTQLGLGQTGFLDADLPEALAPTFFSRYGDKIVWILFFFLTAGVFLLNYRKIRFMKVIQS